MFDPNDLSADDILGHIATTRQSSVENRFVLAELCHIGKGMGLTVGQLAHYARSSSSYIRQLIKTYKAFPTEESRLSFAEMEFSIFKLAAYTDRPEYWVEQAAEHEWSSRELSKAIKGEVIPDALRQADRIYGSVERCFQAGGPGARYLYDQLSNLLRGVDPDSPLFATTQTKTEEAEKKQGY